MDLIGLCMCATTHSRSEVLCDSAQRQLESFAFYQWLIKSKLETTFMSCRIWSAYEWDRACVALEIKSYMYLLNRWAPQFRHSYPFHFIDGFSVYLIQRINIHVKWTAFTSCHRWLIRYRSLVTARQVTRRNNKLNLIRYLVFGLSSHLCTWAITTLLQQRGGLHSPCPSPRDNQLGSVMFCTLGAFVVVISAHTIYRKIWLITACSGLCSWPYQQRFLKHFSGVFECYDKPCIRY